MPTPENQQCIVLFYTARIIQATCLKVIKTKTKTKTKLKQKNNNNNNNNNNKTKTKKKKKLKQKKKKHLTKEAGNVHGNTITSYLTNNSLEAFTFHPDPTMMCVYGKWDRSTVYINVFNLNQGNSYTAT